MRELNVVRLILALIFAASMAQAQERPRIVAVNYPIQYFTERLLGDTAEVIFPVPDGVDPSFWRPAIADISLIQSADLILLNGAGFATWVDRVSLPRSKVVRVSAGFSDRFIATASITHSHGDGGEHSHEGTASYFWLDPELALLQAEAIAEALSSRGLVDGDVGLEALRADLEALDQAARKAVAELNTAIIATHPRYQYFARAYGLEIASLEWEAGAAPSEDQLAELAALAAETEARLLIWEAAPPSEALEAAEALGLKNLIFPPLAAKPKSGDFIAAFAAALAEMSAN